MDLTLARWLGTPGGAAALALAHDAAAGRDALSAAAWLRVQDPSLSPAQAAAVLEQAQLARLAADRYGLAPGSLLLSRDGLEQATRPELAALRAASFAAAGARRVLDLTAGLGFDARAFLAAGLSVVAVERDPVTAALLAANTPGADVVVADAADVLPALLAELGSADVVFVDPARRDPAAPRDRRTARARAERDPALWSPSWPTVVAIGHPRVAAKVAPGLEPPPGWQGQWTSWRRTVVEAQVASWPLAGADRRALVAGPDATVVIDADPLRPEPPPLSPGERLPALLVEPDPAVVRARAVGRLAGDHGLRGLDPGSSWLVGDDGDGARPPIPAARVFRLVTELAGTTRERRRALADLGIDRLVVKSRDARVDPAQVLRELAVAEGGDHVLVLTRRAGRTVSLLARPVERNVEQG